MENLLKLALRTDFVAFCKKAFAELHAGEMPEEAVYIEVVCEFLKQLYAGDFRRAIVNLPPRHLKTFLCTICLTAWVLGHKPDARVMIITYGEDLSRDIADKIRRIMRCKWYCDLFPTRISTHRSQLMDFTTEQGGGVFATSVDAAITGRGADLITLDDPVKVADAANIAVHDWVAERVDSEIVNRLNKPKTGRILIVAHRLHPDDLSGRYAERPGWEQLVLPFISEQTVRISYGNKLWKRKAGELLRPDAYTPDQVAELQAQSGPPDFETLFQQNPTGVPWAALSADSFPDYVGPIPDTCPVVLSIDPAQALHRNASYTVIQVWCAIGDDLVLLEQYRDHQGIEQLKVVISAFSKGFLPSLVLIEATSVGKALAEHLRCRTDRKVIEIDPGTDSKLDRLKSCVGMILSGRVKLKQNVWFRDQFVEEFVSFPYGDSDDQVDATTQLLNFMASSPSLPAKELRGVSNLGTSTGIGPGQFTTQSYESRGRPMMNAGFQRPGRWHR